MNYAVIIHHNFDTDIRVITFDNYDKAKAYLHWVWETYYNEEIANGSYLDEADCWHEEELAKIAWVDKCWTYFELVETSDTPEEEFLKIWRAYL